MSFVDLLLALMDRLKELVTVRKEERRRVLEEKVTPAFEAFSAMHEHYLASFRNYRVTLKSSAFSYPALRDQIETDLRFAEHQRQQILALGATSDDERMNEMVQAIRDYLVGLRITAEPLAGGYRSKRFANLQLWRRTLIAELDAVFEERWAIVLDREMAQPPLNGSDLEAAIRRACESAGIDAREPECLAKLKTVFAVRALDEIVEDMQEAFVAANQKYSTLKATLMQ